MNNYVSVLPVYLYMHRGYTINFAGGDSQKEILRKKTVGSVVAVILQPLCVLYLVTLLISSCILLSIARLHMLASFQNMLQIIALGVTCEY